MSPPGAGLLRVPGAHGEEGSVRPLGGGPRGGGQDLRAAARHHRPPGAGRHPAHAAQTAGEVAGRGGRGGDADGAPFFFFFFPIEFILNIYSKKLKDEKSEI